MSNAVLGLNNAYRRPYCAASSPGLAVQTGGSKRAVLMSRPTKELPHTSLQKVCVSSTATPG